MFVYHVSGAGNRPNPKSISAQLVKQAPNTLAQTAGTLNVFANFL